MSLCAQKQNVLKLGPVNRISHRQDRHDCHKNIMERPRTLDHLECKHAKRHPNST